MRRSDTGRFGNMPSLLGSIGGAPEDVEGGGGVPACGRDDDPPSSAPLWGGGAVTAAGGCVHNVNHA